MKSIPFFLASPYLSLRFSQVFPFLLWEKGARAYYALANYHYDEENTRFDNSIWTYGTDYTLAVIMLFGAVDTWNCECPKSFASLRFYAAAMLLCYSASVTAGAVAHQYFTTVDDLNTSNFRILWSLCVGTVTLAGGFIGAIGSEIGRAVRGMNGRVADDHVPVVPNALWAYWGVLLTAACVVGDISYKRPACDIFIAGTTQILPTAYCVFLLTQRYWESETGGPRNKKVVSTFYTTLQKKFTFPYRVLYVVGFLLNAPLLPLYPVLLSLKMSLGHVNFLLHSNLCVAWGLQYIALRKLLRSLNESTKETYLSKLK